jgi:hypothetical protein
VAVVAVLAYAVLLASTRPFTVPADALTAVGLAAGVGLLVVRLAMGATSDHPSRGTGSGTTAPLDRRRGSWLPWAVLVAVATGWELFCYFGGPRTAHPTLSSIYDLAAGYRWLKAVIVVAWLALGWELVRP